MMGSFYRDSKLSLAKLTESDLFKDNTVPPHQPCCQLFSDPRPPSPPKQSPTPSVQSPYLRKKIFEGFSPINSPTRNVQEACQPVIFSNFSEQSSMVHSYEMPVVTSPGSKLTDPTAAERKIAKKKYKTNKETGLSLAHHPYVQPVSEQKLVRPLPYSPRGLSKEQSFSLSNQWQQGVVVGDNSLVVADGLKSILRLKEDDWSLNYSLSNDTQQERSVRTFQKGIGSPFKIDK